MIKKASVLILILSTLIITYFIMPKNHIMIVWAYFFMLAGLYYAKWFKEAVLISAIISITIIIKFTNQYIYASIASCLFFLALVPIPYYFSLKMHKKEKALSKSNIYLKEKYADILIEHSHSLTLRHRHEESIDRIIQLYIIGREMSKNMTMEEHNNTVLRALGNRIGIVCIAMFEKVENGWSPVLLSKIHQKDDWIMHMKFSDEDFENMDYAIVPNPVFLSRDLNTVFWPLKIDDEFLGCIFIVCEKEYAERYLEEGEIFASQIALGAKRVKLFGEVRERSRIDGLTGLYLKRYFMERLQSEMQREKRYSGGFYILMLDIDHFKKINDKYGHLVGDKVLCAVARALVDCVRPGDLVGRYGGEEFIVFIPMASEEETFNIAEEIRKNIEKKKFKEEDTFNVTISIGISQYPKDGSSIESIINAADRALYRAKEEGRNRVIVYK